MAHYNISSITDTLWLLGKFYSFFLLLPIPLSHQHVHSLLLVNKHDPLKPEHNVKDVLKSWLITFFGNLTYFTGGFMLSNISCNDQEETLQQCQHKPIYRVCGCESMTLRHHSQYICCCLDDDVRHFSGNPHGLLCVSNADDCFFLQ